MTHPTRRVVAMLACLGGCVAPPPPPPFPADPRLLLTPAVVGLDVAPPRLVPARDGRLQVTVEIRNPTAFDIPLRHTTDWLGGSGRPITSLQSRPRFLTVPRFGIATIEADAPNDQARDFRIQIDAP